MKNCSFLLIISFLTFSFFTARCQKHQLPNIVIIMADDLGYGDFSCYGAKKIKTPNIDMLADAGIRFTDAHTASSLCSPSRYSLMTGRYSWRTSLKSGVLTNFAQPLIESGRTTIASLLKTNGYYTACIGKWHLGFDWPLKDPGMEDPDKNVFDSWGVEPMNYIDFSQPIKQGPTKRGFDYFFGMAGSNNMLPYTFIENDWVVSPPNIEKDYLFDTDSKAPKGVEWNFETIDEVLTSKAVEIIDKHFSASKEAPLFLYFPTSAIHRPCLPTFTRGKSEAGMRGDMVVEFDWIVGEITKALKRNNAFENTLFIITSDNGGTPGDVLLTLERYKDEGRVYVPPYFQNYKSNFSNPIGRGVTSKGWIIYDHESAGPYRGHKSDAWEGGHRVPLIFHWPGKIEPGRVSDQMVCNTDILATLSELTGKPLKSNEGEDSYSYYSTLVGHSSRPNRSSMVLAAGGSGAFVVRVGNWKYIEGGNAAWGQTYYEGGPYTTDFQLYNMSNDPYEQNNLFAFSNDEVKKIRDIIHKVVTTPQSESAE